MPRPVSERRRRALAVLRGIAFGTAVVLGAVAIWLIVTSNDQKRIEIGVLIGLWGLLLGAYAVFGSRSAHSRVPPNHTPGQALDLRKVAEIEHSAVANAVAAARREFQAELEEMLRREVQAGLAQEVAGLRAEVTALRNDLVEKVGGQLRLERIETTRLIGSDLEALQHELRQLREIGGAREGEHDDVGAMPATAGSVEIHPAEIHEAEIHEAEIVVERIDRAAPSRPAEAAPAPPMPPPPPAPEPEAVPVPEPAAARAPEPEPQPEPPPEPVRPPATPEPRPAEPADPFASMPRIRPFTDFELDAIPAERDEPVQAGRHASGSADTAARGGRRHRADDDTNDVLARILARESQGS